MLTRSDIVCSDFERQVVRRYVRGEFELNYALYLLRFMDNYLDLLCSSLKIPS